MPPRVSSSGSYKSLCKAKGLLAGQVDRRRGLLLTRALVHVRKLVGSLAPLAGVGEI
jgi:hypothetical protein